MEEISVVGIDLAKEVFQLHGVTALGKAVLRKKLQRKNLKEFIVNLKPCTIVMEACYTSNYWARAFREMGHEVKLIAPQYVKPFVKTNKNDAADAEAIVEAFSRPNMRFVPIKEVWQQDIQCLHRVRSRLVRNHTSLSNEIRALLSEYGIIVGKGTGRLKKELPLIIENAELNLNPIFRELVRDLYEELCANSDKIRIYDQKVREICRQNEECKRIHKIEGVGYLTATAMVAAVGNARNFKNGRAMSAWLGLVPRQFSSGGKDRLLGISKRGDPYLRTLLIHGARSIVINAKQRRSLKPWINQLREKKGVNKASVALANRNARVIWALLTKKEEYKVA